MDIFDLLSLLIAIGSLMISLYSANLALRSFRLEKCKFEIEQTEVDIHVIFEGANTTVVGSYFVLLTEFALSNKSAHDRVFDHLNYVLHFTRNRPRWLSGWTEDFRLHIGANGSRSLSAVPPKLRQVLGDLQSIGMTVKESIGNDTEIITIGEDDPIHAAAGRDVRLWKIVCVMPNDLQHKLDLHGYHLTTVEIGIRLRPIEWRSFVGRHVWTVAPKFAPDFEPDVLQVLFPEFHFKDTVAAK